MLWILLLVIGIVCRSVSMVVQKSMLKGLDKDYIAYSIVYQSILAILISIPLLFIGFHPENMLHVIPNLIIASILYAAGTVAMFASIRNVDASEFTILYSSRVFWTIFLTVIILHAPFSAVQLLGAFFIIGSIVIISWKTKKIQFGKGELFALLAAFCFGSGSANDAIAVKQVDVFLYSILTSIFPALLLWIVFPRSTPRVFTMVKSKAILKLTLFCILLATTTVVLYEAYKVGNPPQVSVLYQTSTIGGVLLAIIFLKETSHLGKKILGTIFTFLGVLLVK